jgi:hypothetical protein
VVAFEVRAGPHHHDATGTGAMGELRFRFGPSAARKKQPRGRGRFGEADVNYARDFPPQRWPAGRPGTLSHNQFGL